MKIAFSGAGGTGKGTLATDISLDYDIPVIRSPVQDVGKMMFPDVKNYIEILSDKKWNFQYAAVLTQIFLEKRLAVTDLAYVSERSLFDYIVYAETKNRKMYQDYKDMILRAYKENPYDIIFYIPYNDFIPRDKEDASWKERDENSRRLTDNFIRTILNEADDSEIVTLTGSVKQREEKIRREIQMLLV